VARADDARGIGRVHARSQHATYRGICSDAALAQITVEERASWWTRALESHDHRWLDLVAEVEGEIIGFACTGPAGFSHGSTFTAYDLYCLYMDPDWERRGFGRRLMDRTFAWLRTQEITEIQVLCVSNTPAHLFYEAIGGRLVEEGQHAEDDGTIVAHRIYCYDLRACSKFLATEG
jgi:GNAT superfamily N-acetyltransferase